MLKSSYLEDEILVNGRKYPVLLMEWSDSLTLKDWINFNISNSSSLLSLAQSFVEVAREMHALYFSHGDLQHENILVDANMNLILVDYDSIFIPGLENLRDEIKGLPGFQHRSRLNLEFCNPTADYFSEYIIYLSLYGLAKKPKLWERAKDHNRLLFSDNDIQNPHTSSIIRELQDIPDLREVLDVFLRNCESESLDKIIPIVEPLGLASSPTASSQQRPIHPVIPSDLKDFSLWNPNPISPSFEWNFSTSTVQSGNTGGKSSASSKPSIDDYQSIHKINQDNNENNSINANLCVEDIKNSMISKNSDKLSTQKSKRRRPKRADSANISGTHVSTINGSNSQNIDHFAYQTIPGLAHWTGRNQEEVDFIANCLSLQPAFSLRDADQIVHMLTGLDIFTVFANKFGQNFTQETTSSQNKLDFLPPEMHSFIYYYTIMQWTGRSCVDIMKAGKKLGLIPPYTLLEAEKLVTLLSRKSIAVFYRKKFGYPLHPSLVELLSTKPAHRNSDISTSKDSSASENCFVATAVYGDASHPDVVLLRKYRDQILSRTVVGRSFISFYWLVGPVLARTVIKASLASRLRPFLSYFVRKVSTELS
jgi:hypothetical protein